GEAALSAARPVRQRRRKSQPGPGQPHRGRAQKARQELRVPPLRRRRPRLFQRRASGLSPGAGARRLEQGVCLLPQTSRCGGRGPRGLRFEEIIMCSYIVEKAKLLGSAKGPSGWMRIDTANVYYDHPFHAPLDHALGIDFISEADGGRERVAVELSAASARELVAKILAALASGEAEHGKAAHLAAARRQRRNEGSARGPENRGGTRMTVMTRTRFDVVSPTTKPFAPSTGPGSITWSSSFPASSYRKKT